jgi:predicted Zn-dependent protease
MTNRILALLKENKRVADYRINVTATESHELFFVHKSLETVRSTDTTDRKVTVFVAGEGTLGDATFSVYASYSDDDIRREIEAACNKASLAANEPYALPADETLVAEADSNFKNYKTAELAAAIAEAVFAADSYDGGSINALEVFLYRDTVSVKNSRGIDKTEIRYRAMVEAIPTWNGAEESVELYECHNFTEFDAAAITAEIDTRMREVRDRLAAKVPEVKPACPVVLGAPELAELFSSLAYELTFAGAYNKTNAFSVDDEIQKNATGDRLNVTMCGAVKGSVRSAAFDSDGTTLVDPEVIRDGRAVGYFGSARYASYLGEKPTGSLGCLRAATGSLSDADLRKTPYFRIASMSGLQLDIYNDYIGGEVRLAYYFDGEREIPVTGISISGKLSTALSGMKLSSDSTVYEGYAGPKLASFEGIEIV